jgi:AraC-like DNA-binding protein
LGFTILTFAPIVAVWEGLSERLLAARKLTESQNLPARNAWNLLLFVHCPEKGICRGREMLPDLPMNGACLPAPPPRRTQLSELQEAVPANRDIAAPTWTDPRIQIVLDFVDSSRSQETSIEAAAAVVFLSPSRFRHLFKEQVGMSFHAYLIRLRLERVRYMLRTTHFTVAQIAEMLDIQDLSHLMRDFKRVYGISPGAMRKLQSREAA